MKTTRQLAPALLWATVVIGILGALLGLATRVLFPSLPVAVIALETMMFGSAAIIVFLEWLSRRGR